MVVRAIRICAPESVARWSAEDNALDASGNGHDGVLIGDTTCTDGRFGRAFLFDGDHVTVPADSAWNFGDGPFSIALWARFDGPCPRNRPQQVLVASDSYPVTQIKWVVWFDGGNNLSFRINRDPPVFNVTPVSLPFRPRSAMAAREPDEPWRGVDPSVTSSRSRALA